jgi:hypothetical protein
MTRPVGLRYDQSDLVTGGMQRPERRHGERGGPGEDDPQEGG